VTGGRADSPESKRVVIIPRMELMGLRRVSSRYNNGAQRRLTASACRCARVFGVISPKTKMARVVTPTAMARLPFAESFKAILDARAEAITLTRLFPIRIVIRNSPGNSAHRENAARLNRLPFRRSSSSRVTGSDVRAVSEAEKKADAPRQETKTARSESMRPSYMIRGAISAFPIHEAENLLF